MAVHDIVVVGGSFAGLSIAHYLLRHTIPKLEASNAGQTYKLTLVSTTDRFFFKIGSPRTVASPNLIPAEKLLIPIADAFKSYSADHFKLVIGTATGLDAGEKIVSVEGISGSSTIAYSTLIIATGSRTSSPLWTLQDNYQQTDSELKKTHSALQNAETVLVAGGGPAGVETAGPIPLPPMPTIPANPFTGEIAYAYPKHKTTILSGSTRLLSRLRPAIGAAAESQLSKLNVTTKHNVRVVSSHPEGEDKTVVNLSDGNAMTVDVYIDATGPVPNSSWLPKSFLNDNGTVKTELTTLRTPTPGVYAIGDVASYSKKVLFDVQDAVRPLASSILHDLTEGNQKPKEVHYKQMQKELQVVPVGQKAGVGIVMGWKVPSWFVWMVKGKTYFIEKAEETVRGGGFVKA